ncbi:MAG: hypothetical protein D6732_22015 [Methanobacteriota archaeon]|nr:MAG: hypothetical protein D6732_22015 [Euryarchaeota archaeon]
MNFVFPLYLAWGFYESFQFFVSQFTYKELVPLYVILPGIERTEVFLILVTFINMLGYILIYRILQKNLENLKK